MGHARPVLNQIPAGSQIMLMGVLGEFTGATGGEQAGC